MTNEDLPAPAVPTTKITGGDELSRPTMIRGHDYPSSTYRFFSHYVFDQALRITKGYEKNKSQIYVDKAEKKLSTFNGPIIAITGSYSKTTTKNTISQVISTKSNVFATPESFNNRLGISKSINEDLNSSHEIAVLEMGTYGFGEIREMCAWVKPHISVITGIAPVHLERMKSLENILDAKSEIVDLTGTVIINGDDELLLNQARLWTAQKMVIDCSVTSKNAAVFVDYENSLHSIYISGKFITSVKGSKILQLSIALTVGVLIALEMDIIEYFQKIKNFTTNKTCMSYNKKFHKINIIYSLIT